MRLKRKPGTGEQNPWIQTHFGTKVIVCSTRIGVSPMSDLTTEVRAALAAATPGPWEQSRGFPAIAYGADRNDIYSRPHEEVERNVHLIAAAPSWLAALCDRLDAAEAKLAAAKAVLSPHTTEAHGCTWCRCRMETPMREPINPADIRVGDRVERVWKSGEDESVHRLRVTRVDEVRVVFGDCMFFYVDDESVEWFLLDRPDPLAEVVEVAQAALLIPLPGTGPRLSREVASQIVAAIAERWELGAKNV